MRVKLRKYLNQTIEIRGTVNSIGTNRQISNKKHIVLVDVKDNIFKEDLTDHAWIRIGKRMFKNIDEVKRGDIIVFTAKVKEYKKGNMIDYGFFYVSRVKIVNKNQKLSDVKVIDKDQFNSYCLT